MSISRTGAALALLVGAGFALAMAAAPSSTASAGRWGAGRFPYRNGIVCPVGDGSVPLVAWDLTGDGTAAWTLGGLVSRGGTDIGTPPAAPTREPVVPGGSDFADVRLVQDTASLLRLWGTAASPARVAEVAELIAEHAGTATGSTCLGSGTGGTSRAEADAMWLEAQKQAGPYTVTVAAPTSFVGGQPTPVRAVIVSRLGYPVTAAPVTFAFAGSRQTAISNSTGTATGSLTVPAGAAPSSVAVTAQLPIGLTRLSAPGAVDAVSLGAPTPVDAAAPVVLDPSSDPQVGTSVSILLARPGAAVSVQADVTGLNGHRATATLTVAGPLPLDGHGSCDSLTDQSWRRAAVNPSLLLQQADAAVDRDGAITAPPVTLPAAGCYSTSARLSTIDASPNVVRDSPFGSPGGTVVVTAASATPAAVAPGVVGSGTLSVPLVVSRAAGAVSTATARVTGPRRPHGGGCDGLSWDGGTSTSGVAVARTGDGPLNAPAGDLRDAGCYRVDVDVSVRIGRLGAIHIPIERTVLLLHPQVEVYESATSVPVGAQLSASAVVRGTYDQRATLSTALLRAPTPNGGCGAVRWAKATRLTETVGTPTSGDGTYRVWSPRPVDQGCHAFAVRLVLDANHAVDATSPVGQPPGVFRAAFAVPPAARGPIGTESAGRLRPVVVFALSGLTMVAACVGVGRTAWRAHLTLETSEPTPSVHRQVLDSFTRMTQRGRS